VEAAGRKSFGGEKSTKSWFNTRKKEASLRLAALFDRSGWCKKRAKASVERPITSGSYMARKVEDTD